VGRTTLRAFPPDLRVQGIDMTWKRTCLSTVAALSSFIAFASAPIACAETPGEAFCAENQRHLESSNGEMAFEV
jgi:hypothetical protein